MADEFAEYIYGTKVRTSEDERVWGLTPQSERRERIVRCRDCAHWRRPTDRERSRCTGVMAFVEPTPDGFCAWGRPREEE